MRAHRAFVISLVVNKINNLIVQKQICLYFEIYKSCVSEWWSVHIYVVTTNITNCTRLLEEKWQTLPSVRCPTWYIYFPFGSSKDWIPRLLSLLKYQLPFIFFLFVFIETISWSLTGWKWLLPAKSVCYLVFLFFGFFSHCKHIHKISA